MFDCDFEPGRGEKIHSALGMAPPLDVPVDDAWKADA
jgi:hypothetical protein